VGAVSAKHARPLGTRSEKGVLRSQADVGQNVTELDSTPSCAELGKMLSTMAGRYDGG